MVSRQDFKEIPYSKSGEAEEQYEEVYKIAEEHQGIHISGQTGFVDQTKEELVQRRSVLRTSVIKIYRLALTFHKIC